MQISDLIRQAIQARGPRGRRYRVRRVVRPTYPTAQAVVYAGSLARPVRDLVQLVELHVIANAGGLAAAASVARRHDSYGDTLEDIIRLVGQEFAHKWPKEDLERLAREMALKLSDQNRRQLTRILSNSLGVPVFFRDGWSAPEIAAWIQTNVGLITSVADQHLGDVRSLVTSTIQSGRTVQDVTREIRERYASGLAGKPRNRAELIARDQVGKFYGNANQLRQRELGVERYVWRGVLDQRERDSHREKEGEIYRWDQPPADTGHPGQDYQCRCTAEPYLADVVPTDVPGREEIMRDIARQQEALRARARERVPEPVPVPAPESERIPQPAPAPEPEPSAVGEDIFDNPEIMEIWGHKLTRKEQNTAHEAMGTIAGILGPGSPKVSLPKIRFGRNSAPASFTPDTVTGKAVAITVRPGKPEFHHFHLAHEFGHAVDFIDASRVGNLGGWVSKMGDKRTSAMQKLIETIKASPEIQAILNLKNLDGSQMRMRPKFRQYALKHIEIFARAFAQFVAVESGDANMLRGLNLVRTTWSPVYQWSDENFEPIRKAMKAFIKERRGGK